MLPVKDICIADRAIFDCTIFFVLNGLSIFLVILCREVKTPCLISLKKKIKNICTILYTLAFTLNSDPHVDEDDDAKRKL